MLKKVIYIILSILLIQVLNPLIYVKADSTQVANSQIGEIAKITELKTTSIITGTSSFDSEGEKNSQNSDGSVMWTAGNDTSENDRVVRSYDQVTYNLLVTFGMKDEYSEIKSLKGGILHFECIIPDNQLNNAYWIEPTANWATSINSSKVIDGMKYRYITGYYNLTTQETTIPGQVSLNFNLRTLGVENGSQIKPIFTAWLEGNLEDEKVSFSPETIYISSKPSYNVRLEKASSQWSYQDFDGDGIAETLGKLYTIPLELRYSMYTETSNIGKRINGLQNPTGDFSFNINLRLKKVNAQTGEEEYLEERIKPIFLEYKDECIDQIRYPKDVGFKYGKLKIIDNGNNKLIATVSDTKMPKNQPRFDSNLNDFNNSQSEDKDFLISEGSIDIFVPEDEMIEENETYNYYLNVKIVDAEVDSYKNKKVKQIYLKDDEQNINHVVTKGNEIQQLFYPYNISSPRISQKYQLGTRTAIGMGIDFNKDNFNNIKSMNQFLKFDSDCVKIDIDYNEKLYNDYKNMNFELYYVTKKDGTNWIDQTEMNNSIIDDMDIYEKYENIPKNKKCIGVYLESKNGYVDVKNESLPIIFVPVYIAYETDTSKTYTMTGYTKVWFNELDRNQYSIKNMKESQFPHSDWDSGERYFTGDKQNNNLKYDKNKYEPRNGGYYYGSILIPYESNPYSVIMSINGKSNPTINYNNNEYIANVDVSLGSIKLHEKHFASKYKIKYSMILKDGVEYVYGSTVKRTNGLINEPKVIKELRRY